MTVFLFRRSQLNEFITTEDPSYRYEIVCGHCGYPLEKNDTECPRCRRALEDCPVCSELRKVKVPVVEPDPRTHAKLCPVCGVRRAPFGPLGDLHARFCSNLYGCPAGGLLLANEELALLPEEATLCPICHDCDLRPLPVGTFLHHVRRCIFCSQLFGQHRRPSTAWAGCENAWRDFSVVAADRVGACPLCGRNDVYIAGSNGSGPHVQSQAASLDEDFLPDSLPLGHPPEQDMQEGHYALLVDPARALVHFHSEKDLQRQLKDLWVDAKGERVTPSTSLSVGQIASALLCGTLTASTRRHLHGRLNTLLAIWEKQMGFSVSDRIPARPSQARAAGAGA